MINHKNLTIELLNAATNTATSLQKSLSLQHIDQICTQLAKEVLAQTYQSKTYTRFAICDPKLREIYAPDFSDRLLQQWLVMQAEPIINPYLIEDTYANQIDKGALAAVKRAQQFMRKPNATYYLQLDIQNFFNSIHRPTLLNLWFDLLKRKQPSNYLTLVYVSQQILLLDVAKSAYVVSGSRPLLASIPMHKQLSGSPIDTGIAIGSVSSQLFANLYLNPLDQFIKHQLKVKYYVRYMDDLLLLADSPQTLTNWQAQISQFLATHLRLNLHPTKQHLQRSQQGADYLGYKIYPHYMHLRKRNIVKLKKYLRFFNQLIGLRQFNHIPNRTYWQQVVAQKKAIDYPMLKKIESVINSYLGLMRHANHYRLRKQIINHHLGGLNHYFLVNDGNYYAIHLKKQFLYAYLHGYPCDH